MNIICPDVYFNRFDGQLDEDNPEKMLHTLALRNSQS